MNWRSRSSGNWLANEDVALLDARQNLSVGSFMVPYRHDAARSSLPLVLSYGFLQHATFLRSLRGLVSCLDGFFIVAMRFQKARVV